MTKNDLNTLIDNTFNTNGSNAITGAVGNNVLKQMVSALALDTGVQVSGSKQVEQIEVPTVSDTSTGISLNFNPIGSVLIFVNGISYQTGSTTGDSFYFVNGTTTADDTNLSTGYVLHYNSTTLSFTLDSNDVIKLSYITQ